MKSTREEVAEILERSADAWESGAIGWIKGSFGDLEQGVCMLGMCRYQVLGDIRVTAVGELYWDVIMTINRVINVPIDDWNDAPTRTKEQVIDLFKNTAKDLRNQA